MFKSFVICPTCDEQMWITSGKTKKSTKSSHLISFISTVAMLGRLTRGGTSLLEYRRAVNLRGDGGGGGGGGGRTAAPSVER